MLRINQLAQLGLGLCMMTTSAFSAEFIRCKGTNPDSRELKYTIEALGEMDSRSKAAMKFFTEPLLTVKKDFDIIVDHSKLTYLDSGLGRSRYALTSSVHGLEVEFDWWRGRAKIRHNLDASIFSYVIVKCEALYVSENH